MEFPRTEWALILGGSSGFGLATAKKMAQHGLGVCVVHRDLASASKRIEPQFGEIRAHGRGFLAVNTNALTPRGRGEALDKLRDELGSEGRVKLVLHSIAFGNLGPLLNPKAPRQRLGDEELAETIHAMGSSLLDWVQALFDREMFATDARVLALTSEGARAVLPGYAAVSAAKSTLESLVRSIAVELRPHGIRCNAIQAGVTDTPALRKIPGHQHLLEVARRRNPAERLTTPEDIANVVYALLLPETAWINGAILPADAGEHLAMLPPLDERGRSELDSERG